MRHDIAALVAAVYKSSSRSEGTEDRYNEMGAEDRHLLARMFGEYCRSGTSNRDDSIRSRIQTAMSELIQLQVAAQKALAEATDGLWFTRPELSGMPDEELAILKVALHESGNTADGRFWLTFQTEHQTYAMRYASSGETRGSFYTAKMR